MGCSGARSRVTQALCPHPDSLPMFLSRLTSYVPIQTHFLCSYPDSLPMFLSRLTSYVPIYTHYLFQSLFKAYVRNMYVHTYKSSVCQYYNKFTVSYSYTLFQYLKHFNLGSLDIFTVYQGVQFLPLDKLVFMKVHQFVNKLESTHP